MSTVTPRRATSATMRHAARPAHAVPADSRHELPDSLPITAADLRAFRQHGWTIVEQRSAGWHYLILRGLEQSAVYKLVGPLFDNTGTYYQGYRIA